MVGGGNGRNNNQREMTTTLIQFMAPLIMVFLFVAVLSSFDWDYFNTQYATRVSKISSAAADTSPSESGPVSDKASFFYICSVLYSETPMMLSSVPLILLFFEVCLDFTN